MKQNNNPKSRGEARRFVSFFSGALGLDIGLQAAGLCCVALNEVDSVACNTIRANTARLADAEPHIYECDVRDLTTERLLGELAVEPEELFAVVGGPPCQAFSTAGRRMGLNDERGNVFLHFIDIIRGLRPKYAVFENVRGLLSAPLSHRPHDQRGSEHLPLRRDEKPGGALLHILAQLEEAGYETTFTLYNTANFGVPQIRERLIFFACREQSEIPFMRPTHDQDGANGLPKWRTLRETIGHLQGQPCHSMRFPESRLKYYRLLSEGQNWRDLPAGLQKKAMGGSWHSSGGKTGFYRRLAWDKPAPTLVTRPTMPATDLCHPEELRPLSVEEYAAIQTFPPDHVFEGNLDSQYRQIGNAVPCLFGKAIGKHIIAFDEGRLKTSPTNGKLSRYACTDHDSWRESVADLQRQLVLYE